MRKAVVLVLVALAAGCGGGGSGSSVDTETDVGTSTGADFELFASEYTFAPPFLLVEKVGPSTFSIRNDGTLPHNFTIDGVGHSPDVKPGETVTFELDLKEGAYEFYCSIGDHKEQGMFGTLNVSVPT